MTLFNSYFFFLLIIPKNNQPVWMHDVDTYHVDISLLSSIIKSIKVYEYFRVLKFVPDVIICNCTLSCLL